MIADDCLPYFPSESAVLNLILARFISVMNVVVSGFIGVKYVLSSIGLRFKFQILSL